MIKRQNDKYTISVYNLIHNCYNIFDFDYPMKKEYKPYFESCFTQWFMFSEIAYHVPGQWKQRLAAHLWINSYKYNKLFESVRLKYDPLINHEIRAITTDEERRINRHEFNNLMKEFAAMVVTNSQITEADMSATELTHQDTTTSNALESLRNGNNDVQFNGQVIYHEDHSENVDTTGESDTTGHLEEDTTTTSTHRVSDTPQNHLDVLGGSSSNPQSTGLFAQYLTMIEDTRDNRDHTADTTEHIDNKENKKTIGEKSGQSTDHQDTKTVYREQFESDEDGQIKFDHDKQNTQRDMTKTAGDQVQDSKNTRGTEGYNTYTNNRELHGDVNTRGVSGTSISKLIVEYRDSLISAIQIILSDFDPYFMGIL